MEFSELKLVDWFDQKLMKDAWNLSAMVSTGFPVEVEKETEKAVKIKITNTHKMCSHWSLWIPKSAILNIEVLGL